MSNTLSAFPKRFRLLKREEFRQKRKRFVGHALVLNYSPSPITRLGIAISRKYGNAVARNRFKRLVREAFRTQRASLPSFDIVALPKKGAGPVSLRAVQEDFKTFHDAQQTAAASR